MFASTIVCFSLISASWMSAVSVEPDGPQKLMIRAFLDRLHGGQPLAPAVDNTQPEALDAYCRWKIDDLAAHVNNYLSPSHMDPNIDYSSHRPPPLGADLTAAWKEIPYLVYLIRYSGLRILNDLKQDLNRGGLYIRDRSLLAVINDEYAGDVSVNYGDVSVNYADNNHPRRNGDSFETLIIYIAIQFSMNDEMLVRNQSPPALLERLETYQGMISDLHNCMARYMQIETRLRYQSTIDGFGVGIEALYQNLGVGGYEHHDVNVNVKKVSKAMLSIIAIYDGGPLVPTSTETISNLLANDEVVRHFMLHPNIPVPQSSDRLLKGLSREIRKIMRIYPPGYPWMGTLVTMVAKLRGVGKRNPL